MVLLGDPHHVADDLQRQRPGQLADRLAVAVGMSGDHRGDQSVGPLAHRCLDAGHHFRGESPADDRSQPLMPRVVEHDHRAEVLGYLRRLVVDGDVGAGAEDLGVAAGVEHVVECGQRPMPVACLEAFLDGLRPERDRGLTSQRGERPIAQIVVECPEVPRAQVNIGERNLGRRRAVHSSRNAHVDRPRR